MTVFSAAFSAAAISAAQDLFEIVAPSDSRTRLLEIDIGQYRFHLRAGQPLASDCRSTSNWDPYLGLMQSRHFCM